ncbi:MAG: hypothetical protein IJP07_01790 [Firmicutes bacterium]|nr:hypothetical protein [Bacillota bacterium]
MKQEWEVRERASRYREMIVQAMEQRSKSPGPMPELELLLLTMVDRLEALLWVLDSMEDDLLDRKTALH